MSAREAEVEVIFFTLHERDMGRSTNALRMSRLEFEALKLRAAQQNEAKRDSINNADATFTLGGNVYTHEYLAWLLEDHHRTGDLPTQQQWAEAKIRQQEYIRKQQEQADENRRRREADEEERRRRASTQMPHWAFDGTNFTFAAGQASGAFRDFNSQFFPGDSQPKPQPRNANPNKVRLAKLAGVEWDDADNMKLDVLKKKAMRKCHPDTGGSHEKWLELTNLLKVMGIPL